DAVRAVPQPRAGKPLQPLLDLFCCLQERVRYRLQQWGHTSDGSAKPCLGSTIHHDLYILATYAGVEYADRAPLIGPALLGRPQRGETSDLYDECRKRLPPLREEGAEEGQDKGGGR